MKKLRLPLTCCIALLFLVSACSVNNTDEQTTVPLLLHVKADDGSITYLGAWDLEQGSVTMDEKLYQSASSGATHPTLWDGKNSFVMDALPVSVENKELSFDNYQVSDGDMIYFCSPYLTITIKAQLGGKRTNTLHYQDENGIELTSEVPDIKPPQEYGIANIVSEQEIFYAAYEEGVMYVFFDAIRPAANTFPVYCLSYNPADDSNGSWTKFDLSGWNSGVFSSSHKIVFWNKKLYMPAVNELLVLDLSNNTISNLSGVTDEAKKIVPNSSQESPAGPRSIDPAGAWDDMVIAHLPVYAQDKSSHSVYFVFKGNELLGAIDITNDAINVYDSALELKNTCLSDSDVPVYSITFPKVR